MMQTHFYGNNLEGPLVGMNVKNYKSNEFFQDIGLDAAVTYSNMRRLNKDMLENCCITFPSNRILLLPGTGAKNRETFERDIGKAVCRVMNDANECVDVVLIDSNSGEDKLSLALMEEADLIVVNLTQHRYLLDKFFTNQEILKYHRKIYYLFGDYDENSSYNINNCRRKYSKHMNYNNSGVIPYCTRYLDAQNNSEIAEFMQRGLQVDKDEALDKMFQIIPRAFPWGRYIREETQGFFYNSQRAIEKMMDMLQISHRNRRKEECMHESK